MEVLKDNLAKLISITKILRDQYHPKKFTLDGRLVGDIGEIYATKLYQITLYPKVVKFYDGTNELTGDPVQIKVTMKNAVGYPRNHDPKILLVLKIDEDGTPHEIYNGPTDPIIKHIKEKNRKGSEYFNFISLTLNTLLELNNSIRESDRIPKRL